MLFNLLWTVYKRQQANKSIDQWTACGRVGLFYVQKSSLWQASFRKEDIIERRQWAAHSCWGQDTHQIKYLQRLITVLKINSIVSTSFSIFLVSLLQFHMFCDNRKLRQVIVVWNKIDATMVYWWNLVFYDGSLER
jgi:hypothetical protein